MKKYLFLSILLSIVLSSVCFSQPPTARNIVFGIQGGVNYSNISSLDQTIIPEPFFIKYTPNSKAFRPGTTFGLFVNFRPDENSIIAGQVETMFSSQSGRFSMNNHEKDFNYKIDFKYQYVNINTLIKVYPWFTNDRGTLAGANIGIGAQYGLNIASENIHYDSWGTGRLPSFGTDLEQQQQLRNVLKGKNNLALIVGAGYEVQTESRIQPFFDFRVNYGFSDVVETQANSYNFRNNKNKNLVFQLTAGIGL